MNARPDMFSTSSRDEVDGAVYECTRKCQSLKRHISYWCNRDDVVAHENQGSNIEKPGTEAFKMSAYPL